MTKQNNFVVRTGRWGWVNVTSTVIRTEAQLIQGGFLGAVTLSNPEDRTYLIGSRGREDRSLSPPRSLGAMGRELEIRHSEVIPDMAEAPLTECDKATEGTSTNCSLALAVIEHQVGMCKCGLKAE